MDKEIGIKLLGWVVVILAVLGIIYTFIYFNVWCFNLSPTAFIFKNGILSGYIQANIFAFFVAFVPAVCAWSIAKELNK